MPCGLSPHLFRVRKRTRRQVPIWSTEAHNILAELLRWYDPMLHIRSYLTNRSEEMSTQSPTLGVMLDRKSKLFDLEEVRLA